MLVESMMAGVVSCWVSANVPPSSMKALEVTKGHYLSDF